MRSAPLVFVALTALTLVACSASKNLNPVSSAGNACGREPFACVNGEQVCSTDANGCRACTCAPPGSRFGNLTPAAPPDVNGAVR